MFKKAVIAVSIATSLFAANGSGIFFDSGLSMSGLKSKDLDKAVNIRLDNAYKMHTSIFEDEPMEGGNKLAPSFTLGYQHSFNKVLSLGAGAGLRFGGYSQITENYTSIENGVKTVDRDYSYNMDYTHLVVPVKISAMAPTRSGGIYLSAAPEFGFLLAAEETQELVDRQDPENSEKITADVKDGLSGFNMALGFRLGGEINVGKHNLLLESGYDFGVSDFLDSEGEGKTGVMTLLALGFRFNTSTIQ